MPFYQKEKEKKDECKTFNTHEFPYPLTEPDPSGKDKAHGSAGADDFHYLRHGLLASGLSSDSGTDNYVSYRSCVLMGPLAGAVCGLAFGITSLITALTGGSPFSSMLLSINPLGLAFTCLVPRVLEGWLCGLIFAALRPRFKNASYFIACLACPLLNTVLFMSSLIFFFYHTDYVQGIAASLGASNPLIFVILFVGIQGAVEAAACTVLGSAVSRTLAAALKR